MTYISPYVMQYRAPNPEISVDYLDYMLMKYMSASVEILWPHRKDSKFLFVPQAKKIVIFIDLESFR